MIRQGSLRSWLVLLAFIAVSPFIALLTYTTYQSWKERQQLATANALISVQFQAERLDTQLRSVEDTLSIVGVLVSTEPTNVAANDALLLGIKETLPDYYNGLALVDPEGRNIGFGTATEAAGPRPTVADRDYFQAALRTRSTVVGDPVVSRSTGISVIPIARAVLGPNREVRAVALAAVEQRRLQELLSPGELPPESVVTVVNTDGVVLARSLDPQTWVGKDIGDTPSVQDALQRREGVSVNTAADGVRRVAAFSTLQEAPWLIYVGIPEQVVFQPVRAALLRDSLLGLMSLLLMLALAAVMAARISRPLVRLAEDAAAFGAGDLGRRSTVRVGAEIEVLTRSFNQMADAISRDIGERVRAEEALRKSETLLAANALEQRQLYEEEQRARAAAEQAVRLREEFLSIASHELRTPLTSVMAHAQAFQRRAARESSLGERDERSLQQILTHAERLNRMIGTMLDVGRIDQGRLQLERTPVDLSALVREVVAGLEGTSPRHKIVVAGGEAALWVAGDSLRLEQALQNLLGNAIKYTPHGGTVTVALTADAATVQVAVRDQGIGIPAQDVPHIFQRFYRATNVSADTITGIGIGLFVVQEIVVLHGGTITAASEEGVGSCFTITLPRAAAP